MFYLLKGDYSTSSLKPINPFFGYLANGEVALPVPKLPAATVQDRILGWILKLQHDPKYPKLWEFWCHTILRSCRSFSINSRALDAMLQAIPLKHEGNDIEGLGCKLAPGSMGYSNWLRVSGKEMKSTRGRL